MARTKGAKNKRQDHLRLYAEELGAQPGEVLLETLLGGLKEYLADGNDLKDWITYRAKTLAKTSGMKNVEAVRYLTAVIHEVMPYVHQKLPTAIDVQGGQVVFAMMMPDGSVQDQAASSRTGGLDLRPANVRQGMPVHGAELPAIDAKSDEKSRTGEVENQ